MLQKLNTYLVAAPLFVETMPGVDEASWSAETPSPGLVCFDGAGVLFVRSVPCLAELTCCANWMWGLGY
jgi:hypothetical protein